MIPLTLIIEDSLSEVVARKILDETEGNYEVVNAISWDKHEIKTKIRNINKSARGHAYFVLTDQDTSDRCPPDAINELSEPLHPNLLYRFAVMEVESWIMAHREAISSFLSVPLSGIPTNPDNIKQPKEHLVNMVKKSISNNTKRAIVPPENSTRKVGPDYNGRLIEFVSKHWNVRIASQSSPSLRRTVERLTNFTNQYHGT